MRSLEDLKARSKPALAYPDLVQIARYAPAPARAYDDALALLREKSHDKEEVRDLARACRFLTIIRRDYGEDEFEKHISENQQKTEKGENIKMEAGMKTNAILAQERTVRLWTGERMRVKSSPTDSLWGFKTDDIVSFTYDGKKAVVLGFSNTEYKSAIVYLLDGEESARYTTTHTCFSLIERKSLLPFKVGGKSVRILNIKPEEKYRDGFIKIIDPYTEKFLIEFSSTIEADSNTAEARCWKWFDKNSIELLR